MHRLVHRFQLAAYVRRVPVLAALMGLALAGFLCFAGCGEDEPVTRVDLSKREDVTLPAPGRAITYAYLPQYSHTVSFERHRLLLDYLRQATGLPLRQIFPDTFDEHLKMVERGEIDISFSNPFVYVALAERGARAFARIIEPSGSPDFYSQIICRKDNPRLNTIQDVRGARWIAVDPYSAGGYLFALGAFYDAGILPDDFAEIAFAPGPGGKQEKVVLSVYAGVYDIGSIRDGTLQVLQGKIDLDQIRILAESPAYPSWVYAARRGLDPDVVERIGKAMFALSYDDPADREILEAARMHGIIPAKDSDYAKVRQLTAKLDIVLGQGQE